MLSLSYFREKRRNMLLTLLDAPNDLVARSILCDEIEDVGPVNGHLERVLYVLRESIKTSSVICVCNEPSTHEYFSVEVVLKQSARSMNKYELNRTRHKIITWVCPGELPKIDCIEQCGNHWGTTWFIYSNEEARWECYFHIISLLNSIPLRKT